MTREEVNERYMVPMAVLDDYERWNLCEKREKADEWQYDDHDLELLSRVVTLYEFGFKADEAETYMRLYLEGVTTSEQRIRILSRKRKYILDEIHEKERQLSKLDYMRYEIEHASI